jgi:glycine cleavage system H protein
MEAGGEIGTIESVKTADAVMAPVSGEVLEVNELITENPEILNQSPEADGWILKLKVFDPAQLSELMSPERYVTFCEEEDHH